MAWDDEPCSKRGPGLTHTTNGTARCVDCGVATWNREHRPIAPVPRRVVLAIPDRFRDEYRVERQRGLSDLDAQALIALRYGLGPPAEAEQPSSVEQRQRTAHGGGATPWTLRELARLEFIRWDHAED